MRHRRKPKRPLWIRLLRALLWSAGLLLLTCVLLLTFGIRLSGPRLVSYATEALSSPSRQVTLEALELRCAWTPSLQLRGFSMVESRGSATNRFLAIEQAQARIKLLPLTRRIVRIENISLTGAHYRTFPRIHDAPQPAATPDRAPRPPSPTKEADKAPFAIDLMAMEVYRSSWQQHDATGGVKRLIKVTEAPHYRRYLAQQNGKKPIEGNKPFQPGPAHPQGHKGLTFTHTGVNAGKGFCFVDHIGEVYPSGFLPVSAGQVRETSIIDLYRSSPMFKDLRNLDLLKGRCGRCGYRDICGGSRSRAYAETGDYLAEEPYCSLGSLPQRK